MMEFLAAGWLAALAALAVPIVLHLWTRRPSRVVRLGSVRHLEASPAVRARSLRLHEPWLLALRLAALTLVVLALAQPLFRRAQTPRAVALVAPELAANDSLVRTDPVLDSLRRSGGDVRGLAPGFPAMRWGAAIRAAEGGAAEDDEASHVDWWSLIAELDRELPAGSRLLVVAPANAERLTGVRPGVASEVRWHAIEAPRTAARGRAAPAVRVIIHAGTDRVEDARYLAAAFRSIGEGHRGTQVRIVPATTSLPPRDPSATDSTVSPEKGAALSQHPPSSTDWIVWLGDTVPAGLREHARAGGVALTDGGAANGVPVWTMSTGAPLLTVAREGRGTRYVFAGRFHPSVHPFILSPEFPDSMLALWRRTIGVASRAERLSAQQATPARVAAERSTPMRQASAGAGTREGRHNLSHLLWALAVMLLCIERILASRPRGVSA